MVNLLFLVSNVSCLVSLTREISVILIDHDSRVSFLGGSVRTDNGFKSCYDNSFLVSLFHV